MGLATFSPGIHASHAHLRTLHPRAGRQQRAPFWLSASVKSESSSAICPVVRAGHLQPRRAHGYGGDMAGCPICCGGYSWRAERSHYWDIDRRVLAHIMDLNLFRCFLYSPDDRQAMLFCLAMLVQNDGDCRCLIVRDL